MTQHATKKRLIAQDKKHHFELQVLIKYNDKLLKRIDAFESLTKWQKTKALLREIFTGKKIKI